MGPASGPCGNSWAARLAEPPKRAAPAPIKANRVKSRLSITADIGISSREPKPRPAVSSSGAMKPTDRAEFGVAFPLSGLMGA